MERRSDHCPLGIATTAGWRTAARVFGRRPASQIDFRMFRVSLVEGVRGWGWGGGGGWELCCGGAGILLHCGEFPWSSTLNPVHQTTMRLLAKPIAGAIAGLVVLSSSPLAAEPPPLSLPPALLSMPASPSDPASSLSDDDARRVEGSLRAVLATEAEAKELRAKAQSLAVPSVPTDSDLGRLLSGENKPAGSSQSPRAHN